MKKIKCILTNIDWDTDGEEIKDLPNDVTLEIDYDDEYGTALGEEVTNELSNRYGFCVNSFNVQYFGKDGFLLDNWGDRVNEVEGKVS